MGHFDTRKTKMETSKLKFTKTVITKSINKSKKVESLKVF